MKLSVIIPVYNEARTVKAVLHDVLHASLPGGLGMEVIVVDNGSTDGSFELADAFARLLVAETGRCLSVVRHLTRGKGSAVREGFRLATGDIILIQDADREYDVSDYESLLDPILQGKTDLVLGSRHLAAGTWKIRSFKNSKLRSIVFNLGGLFFHGFFNFLYGTRLTDPTTMYKVMRRECLDGLTFRSNRFDFDYELLGKLIRKGYKPLEVAVTYRSRGFEDGKKIRVFQDPFTWVWAILRFRFSPL